MHWRHGRRTVRSLAGASLLALALVVQGSIQAPIPGYAATVLYSDDFESDAIGASPAGWLAVSGTWSVALDGTHVMKQTDTSTATAKSISAGLATWTDYAVRGRQQQLWTDPEGRKRLVLRKEGGGSLDHVQIGRFHVQRVDVVHARD
jgi:hypothetical protein